MSIRFSEFIRAWQGDRSDAACGLVLFRSQECIRSWAESISVPTRPSFPILAPLLGTTVDDLAAMVEAERAARAAARMVDLGGVAPVLDSGEGAASAVASPETSGAFHV